jgi:hypothetical protein
MRAIDCPCGITSKEPTTRSSSASRGSTSKLTTRRWSGQTNSYAHAWQRTHTTSYRRAS